MSDVIETIALRFKSGNDVPVTRAHITREEFDRLRAELAHTKEFIGREGYEWRTIDGEHYDWYMRASEMQKRVNRSAELTAARAELAAMKAPMEPVAYEVDWPLSGGGIDKILTTDADDLEAARANQMEMRPLYAHPAPDLLAEAVAVVRVRWPRHG